jgi:hypothetical protein
MGIILEMKGSTRVYALKILGFSIFFFKYVERWKNKTLFLFIFKFRFKFYLSLF